MKYLKPLCYVLFAYFLLKAPNTHYKILRNYVATRTVTLTFTDTKKYGGGTGVQVALPHGGNAILTNGHVCALKDDHNEILVVSPLLAHPMNRRVISIANFTDLCLIEGIPGLPGLSLGEQSEPGDIVAVVGHPFLMPTTMNRGEIIGEGEVDVGDYEINTPEDEANCNQPKNKILTIEGFFGSVKVCVLHLNAIHTTAVIFPGNSGSGVVDARGRIIGLAFAGNGRTNWGLLITLEDIKQFLYSY